MYVEIQRWEPIHYGNGSLKYNLKLLQEAGINVEVVGLKFVFMRGKTFRDGMQSGQFISLQDFAKRELEKIKPESKQSFNREQLNFLKTLNEKVECDELERFDINVERSKIEKPCGS